MLTDFRDPIHIAFEQAALPDDHRREPEMAGVLSHAEPTGTTRLDPSRLDDWRFPGGPIGSLLLHLLPLLTLVSLAEIPADIPAPVAVQIVFENPVRPSAPAAFAVPEDRSPSRVADTKNVDKGETTEDERGIAEGLVTFGEPQPSTVQAPTPALASPPPLSEPAAPQRAAQDLPPEATPDTRMAEAVPSLPPTVATRDDYLAYLVALTRKHLDLLPLSMIGNRRGSTAISLVVYDDGSIAHISIDRSSGYPDIDRRIQAMVAAVGRFPPIPRQFQGTAMQLELTVRFPETWEQ
jgi:TonB family protein